jgi:hypothetical protein
LQPVLLTFASLLLVATMCVHSALGQRRIIRPLLEEGAGVMRKPLARFIVPFAWHLTSGIGLVLSAILFAWAWMPEQATTIGLVATGIAFTVSGVADAIGSKGKHIGWAPLTLVGLSALFALLLT